MKFQKTNLPGVLNLLILGMLCFVYSSELLADCTGCTTTNVGGDVVYTFTANGTFTPPAGVTEVEYLLVAGGGGGGGITAVNAGGAGGGGAGGVLNGTGFAVTPLTVFNIVVGAGGAGGVGGAGPGGNGGNSSFSTLTADGGGGGASLGNNNGVAGGSGGGGRLTAAGIGGAGTAGQGNDGGDGAAAGFAAGGGGGAAAVGANGLAGGLGGAGGAGVVNAITGAAVAYAGGGGGGGYNNSGGAGGVGGGGAAPLARGPGGNATPNTGGGGGGASGSTAGAAFIGGAGGSGIVVIRYTPPPFTCPGGADLTGGIIGEYFNLTAPPPTPLPGGTPDGTRVDGPIDFDWGGGNPGVPGIGADDFAVRWDGLLRVTSSGNYQFQTVSDDGVRLWVDGNLVIDNWTDHAATTDTSGNVALTAGQVYDIRLEFYENGGQAVIRLRWGPSGGPFAPIPAGPTPVLGEGLYHCGAPPLPPLYLEANQVTLNDTNMTPTFTSVSFLQTYPTPPLVFVLPTNENTDPAAIRIRNVTTTGFEMAQVEPEPQDGRSVPMTVDYIAMTEGVFTLPDGRTIEAGTHTTQTVQHGSGVPGGEGWDTVNFSSSFSNPSVLLQIQDFANEYNNPPNTTSRPWLTASIRNVGNTSFQTALERSEVNDGNPATINTDETIAYLAIDGNVQGSFPAQGTTILYETIVSADSILGWDNENCAGNVGERIPFVNSYTATPLAIAHTRRHDGADGGWIRRCFLDNDEIGLAYDEDIFRDSERLHTTEQASILVFSEAFCYPTCVGSVIDHYDIDFASPSGITCLPVDVTITAKDNTNTTVNHTSDTTIDFVTSTGRGTWSSTASAGTGTVTPGTPGNGDASYEFPAGEASVTISLNYPDLLGANSETFSINITSAITETSGTAPGDVDPGDGTDDPTIDFFLTGIIYNNVDDSNNTIPTQISGKPSNTGFNSKTLNLQVVRATDNDPSVCASIFGPGDVVSIELGAECKNPGTCAGRELNISNVATPSQDIDTSNDDGDNDYADSVASYEAVNLQFGADSAAEIVLTYPDAGSLELHARYELLLDDGSPSGEYAAGISNPFVVRPFGFAIGEIENSDGNSNPGADTPGGNDFTRAGMDFKVSVGAFTWQAVDDDGSTCDLVVDPGCSAGDGIPDTNADLLTGNAITPNFSGTAATDTTLTAVVPFAPSAGILGQLLDSTTDATPVIAAAAFGTSIFGAGIADIDTLYYTEVGSMTMQALATDYLGTGENISGRSSNLPTLNPNNGVIGRFIPDRFSVTDNNPAFVDECTVTNPFTYMSQAFYYGTAPELTITALNTKGNVTQNYGDTDPTDPQMRFWKLDSALNRTYNDQAGAAATFADVQDTDVIMDGDLDYDGIGTLALDSGTDGDAFNYMRVDPEIEFPANVDVTFTAATLTDEDDVCHGPGFGTCEDYTIAGITGANLRFGRLVIGTAAGSELLPVTVPLRTEYFDGTMFVLNEDDDCTELDLVADIQLSNPETMGGTPQPGNTTMTVSSGSSDIISSDPVIFADGRASLIFSPPGANNTGYIDIQSTLDYLLDDTDGDNSYDDNPTGRATFGVFEGPRTYIYIREPW